MKRICFEGFITNVISCVGNLRMGVGGEVWLELYYQQINIALHMP